MLAPTDDSLVAVQEHVTAASAFACDASADAPTIDLSDPMDFALLLRYGLIEVTPTTPVSPPAPVPPAPPPFTTPRWPPAMMAGGRRVYHPRYLP